VTHEPVDGRVARTLPVWNNARAGVCVGLNVYIERMTHISSTTLASCGRSSLTSTPLRPYRLNSNGDGINPAVVRSVRRSTALGR
jgi:hypothetical protein